VDSPTSKTTEGRSLDNPKRGSSDDRAECDAAWGTMLGRACEQTGVRAAGPGSVGKAGAKVRRVKRSSPNKMYAPRTKGPRRQGWWHSPRSRCHGGQQRRPNEPHHRLVLPLASESIRAVDAAKAARLPGVEDAEQEGSDRQWNGHSESTGAASKEVEPSLGNGEPRQRWFPPGRTSHSR